MGKWCNALWRICMFISRLRDVFLFADGAGLQSSDGAFWWNPRQATAYTSHGCVGVYVLARLSPDLRFCYGACCHVWTKTQLWLRCCCTNENSHARFSCATLYTVVAAIVNYIIPLCKITNDWCQQTALCAQKLILCRRKLMQSWTGKCFAYIILKDNRHTVAWSCCLLYIVKSIFIRSKTLTHTHTHSRSLSLPSLWRPRSVMLIEGWYQADVALRRNYIYGHILWIRPQGELLIRLQW